MACRMGCARCCNALHDIEIKFFWIEAHEDYRPAEIHTNHLSPLPLTQGSKPNHQ